jgi:hypothetical protein
MGQWRLLVPFRLAAMLKYEFVLQVNHGRAELLQSCCGHFRGLGPIRILSTGGGTAVVQQ